MTERASGGPGRARLFVAIEVPASVGDAVDEAARPWRGRLPGARWVSADRRHVTLAFLGSVEPDRIPWIRERLDAQVVAAPAVRGTVTTELGSFPDRGPAKVLWAGLSDPEGGLGELAGAVRVALEPVAEQGGDRSFRAHITVARFGSPLRLPTGVVGAPVGPVTLPVRRLVLYRSDPGGRSGPKYTPVHVVPLDG